MADEEGEEHELILGKDIIWAGWLQKKKMTGIIDSWKRRFCFITDESIYYFEPQKGKLQRPHAQNGQCPELEGVSDVVKFLLSVELKEKGFISMVQVDKCQTSQKNYRFTMIVTEPGTLGNESHREYKFNAMTQSDRSSFFKGLQQSKKLLSDKMKQEAAKGIVKKRGASLDMLDAAFGSTNAEGAQESPVEWDGWLQKSGDSKLGSSYKWRFFTVRNERIEYWCAPSSVSEKKCRADGSFTTKELEKEKFSMKGKIPLKNIGKVDVSQRNLTCQIITGGRIYIVRSGEDQSAIDNFSDVISRLIGDGKEVKAANSKKDEAEVDAGADDGAAEVEVESVADVEVDRVQQRSSPQNTSAFEDEEVAQRESGPRPTGDGRYVLGQTIEESPYQCEVHVMGAQRIPKNTFLGTADVKVRLSWDTQHLTPELTEKLEFYAPEETKLAATEVGETSVIEKTLDPIWEGQSFPLTVPPLSRTDLLLNILDTDMGDELIGTARLSPSELRDYGRFFELPIVLPEGVNDAAAEANDGVLNVYVGLPGMTSDSNFSKQSKQDRKADVSVLEAVGLPEDVTDPYVTLNWGPDEGPAMKIGNTSVIDTGMLPAWSDKQRFHIILSADHIQHNKLDYLNMEVWDYRSKPQEHIFIGSVCVSSSFVGHLSHTHWLPLQKEGKPIEGASLSVFIGYVGQVVPEHSRRLKLRSNGTLATADAHGIHTRKAVLATKEAKAAEKKVDHEIKKAEAGNSKSKRKKKKRPEDIEWSVRITLMEVIDLPEPPFLGTRNTFVTFELNDENKKSHMRVGTMNPRWSPAEMYVFRCSDVTKDILEVTVFMYSQLTQESEPFGFVLVPLGDLRGVGFRKETLLVKSFETGQLQTTGVVFGIEVLDAEDAFGRKEHRIHEYEAYSLSNFRWGADNLSPDEPRFELDHSYGDHELVDATGDSFEQVEPEIPHGFRVERNWVPTILHGGDDEGWDYARTYKSEEWYHQNSPLLMYRRKTITRLIMKIHQ